jgi:sulfite oxidase
MNLELSRRELLGSVGILAVVPNLATALAQESRGPLQILTEDPPNAEPYVDRLVESWLTPVEQFYVRSYSNPPAIDPETYRLSVEGMVERPLSLSLADLKEKLPRREAACTMTCAGNRRTEHMAVKPIDGVPWGPGAIGNAKWSGFPLSEVLKLAGVKAGATHVWFEALDAIKKDGKTAPFGGSITLDKALSDTKSVPGAIVCDTMQGAPLTPNHGWPLRMVVPGFIGARSVKWLGRIIVSNRPSSNYFLAKAYKLIYENTPQEVAEAAPLMEFALNSVIGQPLAKSNVKAGPVTVKGYALPPGKPGVTIARVELSTDGGKTWKNAKLTSKPQEYCWQLWEAKLPADSPSLTLTVRATSSDGQVQPQTVEWNHKGYMFNAWHHVEVNVGS